MVARPSGDPPITYYALDLEERELQRTLDQITASELGPKLNGKVLTKGMWGTYDDGLKFVQSGLHASDRPQRVFKPVRFDERDTSPESVNSDSSGPNDVSTDVSPPSTPEEHPPPLHILFLGSSLGNFSRTEQADFLRSLPLRPGSGDTLLLGLDHDNPKDTIEVAYNDPKGYTEKFIFNGLKSAGRVLGDELLFDEDKWEYVNVCSFLVDHSCSLI
jgi:L-histidine Nalpha-methyltransferase / hercynylcysteine S-oxide synthase